MDGGSEIHDKIITEGEILGFEEKSEMMKKTIDSMAFKMWGKTVSESLKQGICVKCGKHVNFEKNDIREYNISALCDACFGEMTE